MASRKKDGDSARRCNIRKNGGLRVRICEEIYYLSRWDFFVSFVYMVYILIREIWELLALSRVLMDPRIVLRLDQAEHFPFFDYFFSQTTSSSRHR